MKDLIEIIATIAIAFCFCFFVFNVRSCTIESEKLAVEKLKYPVKVEREYTTKQSIDTRPQEK